MSIAFSFSVLLVAGVALLGLALVVGLVLMLVRTRPARTDG